MDLENIENSPSPQSPELKLQLAPEAAADIEPSSNNRIHSECSAVLSTKVKDRPSQQTDVSISLEGPCLFFLPTPNKQNNHQNNPTHYRTARQSSRPLEARRHQTYRTSELFASHRKTDRQRARCCSGAVVLLLRSSISTDGGGG